MRCVEIVQQTQATGKFDGLVVVTSALTQVTNQLLQGANDAASGDMSTFPGVVERVTAQHQELGTKLGLPEAIMQVVMSKVVAHLEYYTQLCQAMGVLRELSARGLDAVGSLGERMALPLLCGALEHGGIAVEPVDASECLVTDENFQEARPLMDESTAKTCERLHPVLADGKVAVVTGFVAATVDGTTTTLGRGGSDYSAALLANCLKAAEVWIWTDVVGIMSADPRVVPEARTIPKLSLREVAELAYFGAKVLHPKTIRPCVAYSIPLRICNTFDPDADGTWVRGDGTGMTKCGSFENIPSSPGADQGCIKAVTAMKDMALITLSGRGMIGCAGLSSRLFDAVTSTGTSVSLITQASSEQSICLSVPMANSAHVSQVIEAAFSKEIERQDVESVSCKEPVSIITVVGAEMCSQVGVAGKVFSAMGDSAVNVVAIAQGSSEVSISMVVNGDDTTAATAALHQLTHRAVLGC